MAPMSRLMIALALLLCCGAAALYQPRAAYACSCVPPPPPREARDGAVAVFAGTASSIAPTGPGGESRLVTFDLQQTWKGPAAPQVTIVTSGSSASCGYEFTLGEQYLVYGFAQEGQIHTGLCSRTAPLADAGADLAALGAGTPVAGVAEPIATEQMGVPWLPLALAGIGGALLLAVLIGWLRRR